MGFWSVFGSGFVSYWIGAQTCGVLVLLYSRSCFTHTYCSDHAFLVGYMAQWDDHFIPMLWVDHFIPYCCDMITLSQCCEMINLFHCSDHFMHLTNQRRRTRTTTTNFQSINMHRATPQVKRCQNPVAHKSIGPLPSCCMKNQAGRPIKQAGQADRKIGRRRILTARRGAHLPPKRVEVDLAPLSAIIAKLHDAQVAHYAATTAAAEREWIG